MISALHFEAASGAAGRRIRTPRFRPRSGLPIAAACLVANGVREHLSRLLGCDLETEVVEPVLPDPRARERLFAGSLVLRVKGTLCDAFVALRPADARLLATAAFGESALPGLSQIERSTVERILGALPPLCAPLCGSVRGSSREDARRAAFDARTYFEVRTVGAVRAAFAFALALDPPEAVANALTLEELTHLEVECAVEVASGPIELETLEGLAEGDVVPFSTPLHGHGRLLAEGVAIALGTCGSCGDRAAFTVRRLEREAA